MTSLQFTSADEPPSGHQGGSITFYNPHIWFKVQNSFLKPMILFCVKLVFSFLRTTTLRTSEISVRPDDPTNTQLLASHYDCPKHYNLRQFSFIRVQKRTHAPLEIEHTRKFAAVFARANTRRVKTFSFSATVQKDQVICAQGAHDKHYRHDRKYWHTNSLLLTKELEPYECKNNIGSPKSTGSP